MVTRGFPGSPGAPRTDSADSSREETPMAGRTVKMRGNPLPVAGPELHAGDRAPDFKLHQRGPDGLRDVTLHDFAGKTLVLSVVPSLDTPVCEAQTKHFDEEA